MLLIIIFILQDAIKKFAYEMFHAHEQLTEQQMKERLKEKLDGDEHCVDFLRKFDEKGLTFDDLWNKKLYSAVSTNVPVYIM